MLALRRAIKFAGRWLGIVGLVAALLWLCSHHGHGGAKGSYIPLPNVILCVFTAAGAAWLCKRYWLAVASPFVGGIAGVFGIARASAGPFGGAVGLVVGLLVALLPLGTKCRRAEAE
jgi:hypothetical protein